MQPFPSSPEPPWIIAHRGASADYPENSLAAFEAAARADIDAIEMDVQLSRDGVPVVFHDETLARIDGGPARISECDWADLQRVGVGAWFDPSFRQQMLPSLADVLQALPDQILCVELKSYPSTDWDALARRATDVLVEHDAQDRVLLLSFDHRLLAVAREICPALRTVGLFRRVPPDPAEMDPFYAVDISIHRATAEFVAAAQVRKRPVIVYTCNTEAEVEKARALEVNAITTDRPVWLAAM